ncbi:MAG: C4-dicarboxylate ABC transporter [Deltaproteobacteria bacterium]|nr:MAG: C4-dicarboxylate ABC transporter [Deltaproteobacteria bacterium]
MKRKLGIIAFTLCIIAMATFGGTAESKPVVLKISHVESTKDTLQQTGLMFEKYVEKNTKGSIDVQLYPNSELANDVESVEGCIYGTIQMALPSTAQISNYQASYGILDMPFIFKDLNTAFSAVDGELGNRLKADAVKSGLHVLGFYFIGNRSVTNNRKPIQTPADMKGLDIRVMESAVYIATMKALGANPTPMAFSELYTALQQGAVDGQENGPSIVYNYKFYEVQKYYSLTDHTVGFGVVTMGESFFSSLTKEQQEVIEKAAKMFLIDKQREMKIAGEDGYVDKIIKSGTAVNKITPKNHLLFVKAVQPVYAQFKDKIGQDIFDLVDKYNNQ